MGDCLQPWLQYAWDKDLHAPGIIIKLTGTGQEKKLGLQPASLQQMKSGITK